MRGPNRRTEAIERLLALPPEAQDAYICQKRPFGAQLEYELRSRRERAARRRQLRAIGALFVASLVVSIVVLAAA